jgi:hypothetical protein
VVAVVVRRADGVAPRQNLVEDGEIVADRGADLRQRGVKHQPLNRQISEWERVIKYYYFVTIIEPQYNYLASKDRNGSGR